MRCWSGVVAAVVTVVAAIAVTASACSDDDGPAVCPGNGISQPLGILIESGGEVYKVAHVPHNCEFLGCATTVAASVRTWKGDAKSCRPTRNHLARSSPKNCFRRVVRPIGTFACWRACGSLRRLSASAIVEQEILCRDDV